MDEQSYNMGSNTAWRYMLNECRRHLNLKTGEAELIQLQKERLDTLVILRSVCEDYGDNDWPDDLHLVDIIAKHLWNYLMEECGK